MLNSLQAVSPASAQQESSAAPVTTPVKPMSKKFQIIDVFTSAAGERLQGAQIAVIDGDGLSDEKMIALAREFGTETVFILPADARGVPVGADSPSALAPLPAASIRVFSPLKELPFAGHPMMAAIFSVANAKKATGKFSSSAEGGEMSFGLRQRIGVISCSAFEGKGKGGEIESVGWKLPFDYTIDKGVPVNEQLAAGLGLSPDQLEFRGSGMFENSSFLCRKVYPVQIGTPYTVVPVKSYQAVRSAKLDDEMPWLFDCGEGIILLTAETPEGEKADFHARIVGKDVGIHEDPPIGNSMPSLASYLLDLSGKNEVSVSVSRGTEMRSAHKLKMSRYSLLHITVKSMDLQQNGHASNGTHLHMGTGQKMCTCELSVWGHVAESAEGTMKM